MQKAATQDTNVTLKGALGRNQLANAVGRLKIVEF
jgi:hypothetical protein